VLPCSLDARVTLDSLSSANKTTTADILVLRYFAFIIYIQRLRTPKNMSVGFWGSIAKPSPDSLQQGGLCRGLDIQFDINPTEL